MSNLAMMMGLGSAAGGTPAPDAIGAEYGGGYYAGKIVQDNIEYYLIVAPKATGEISNQRQKTSDSATTGTSSVIDGPTNSANMNDTTHPAAYFCEGLSIGGYDDWYLPAKDELEVCYRNLKPTTVVNHSTSGVNSNSVPTGTIYTTGDPLQTTVTAFQTGGSEAFASSDYWSSTERATNGTRAERQHFNNGDQNNGSKTDLRYARAVRRVAV